jgi:hypothetical protein
MATNLKYHYKCPIYGEDWLTEEPLYNTETYCKWNTQTRKEDEMFTKCVFSDPEFIATNDCGLIVTNQDCAPKEVCIEIVDSEGKQVKQLVFVNTDELIEAVGRCKAKCKG